MPRLHKYFWVLSGVLAVFSYCSSQSWSQDVNPTPTETTDPYFDKPSSSTARPLKPIAESPKQSPATQPMGLADKATEGKGAAKANPFGGQTAVPYSPQPKSKSNGGGDFPNLTTQQGVAAKTVPVDQGEKLPLSQAGKQADRESIESLTQQNLISESAAEQFEPGRVLAIVGGRPILVGDLLYEINEMIEQHAEKAPETFKQAQRQQLVPRLLPKFVDRQLIYVDTIRELPEGADLEKINESLGKAFDEEALPQFLKKSGAPSSLQFDAQLRSLGSSLRQFRQAWVDDQFVKYFVGQKMKSDEEISLQELRDYYDQHADEYAFPARARWEQLEVRFAQVPDRKAARRMISEMGNEVVFGAPLGAVAKKQSHDLKAKEGGQQGWITQGSLAADSLDKALFEIPLNELSDVIETPTAYHIVRVLERTPAGRKPFREAQVEIKEKLLQAQREKRFEDYITKLRREIPIEVVDRTVKLPDKYLMR